MTSLTLSVPVARPCLLSSLGQRSVTLHCFTLHCLHWLRCPGYNTLNCPTLNCTSLPCIALPYTALPFTALHCTALPAIPYITPHCTARHCTALAALPRAECEYWDHTAATEIGATVSDGLLAEAKLHYTILHSSIQQPTILSALYDTAPRCGTPLYFTTLLYYSLLQRAADKIWQVLGTMALERCDLIPEMIFDTGSDFPVHWAGEEEKGIGEGERK